MAFNKFMAMGRMTSDIELKTSQSGNLYGYFGIAINNGENERTDFFNCTAFGKTADFIGKYFTKGSLILIEGSIKTSEYTEKDTGKKRIAYNVNIDRAFFSGEKKTDTPAAYGAKPQVTISNEEINQRAAEDFSEFVEIADSNINIPF